MHVIPVTVKPLPKVCFLGKVVLSDAKVFPKSLILTSEPSVKLEKSPRNINTSIPWDLATLINLTRALLSVEWDANNIK